jgi:hypothetical protein
MGVIIDLTAGLFLYISLDIKRRQFGRWSLLLLCAIPAILALVAYVFFINFDRYLDFVLPTVLYFIHLMYEHISHYVHLLSLRNGGGSS